jgi:hypothetical protein
MIDTKSTAPAATPAYEAPRVADYGDIVELTAGASDGCYLDSDFPSGTMKTQLGFSC